MSLFLSFIQSFTCETSYIYILFQTIILHRCKTWKLCLCVNLLNTKKVNLTVLFGSAEISSRFVNRARGGLRLCMTEVNTVMAKWTRCWVCPEWRQRALWHCTFWDTGCSLEAGLMWWMAIFLFSFSEFIWKAKGGWDFFLFHFKHICI